jgi:hypothetical protein
MSGTSGGGGSGGASHMSSLRRLDSAGERSHRQLIDCIRSKDTDALIDAIDNGSEYVVLCTDLLHVLCYALIDIVTVKCLEVGENICFNFRD